MPVFYKRKTILSLQAGPERNCTKSPTPWNQLSSQKACQGSPTLVFLPGPLRFSLEPTQRFCPFCKKRDVPGSLKSEKSILRIYRSRGGGDTRPQSEERVCFALLKQRSGTPTTVKADFKSGCKRAPIQGHLGVWDVTSERVFPKTLSPSGAAD